MVNLRQAKQCNAKDGLCAPALFWSTIFLENRLQPSDQAEGRTIPDRAVHGKYCARPAV
jgi:hypothetical protein